MKSQVALLLFCLFFNKALALKCNQCTPTTTSSGLCSPVTQMNCSGTQCASIISYSSTPAAGSQSYTNIQTCGSPELCTNNSLTYSMNYGYAKVATVAKCCSTDLCNTDTPADLQSANGKTCYTCDSNDCSKTLNCEGIEDRCITASVEQGGYKGSVKGCASKNICDAASGSYQQGIAMAKLTCCEGNMCNGGCEGILCNGAETFTLSFLILLVPLLSSILLL